MTEITVVYGFDMETDCGSWSPYYEGLKNGTPKLLKLLRQKKATATFFFTGEAAKLHPKVGAVHRESRTRSRVSFALP